MSGGSQVGQLQNRLVAAAVAMVFVAGAAGCAEENTTTADLGSASSCRAVPQNTALQQPTWAVRDSTTATRPSSGASVRGLPVRPSVIGARTLPWEISQPKALAADNQSA